MFGRWQSVTFREYFRLGDLQYRHLIDLMAKSAGLTDQLRAADGNAGKIRVVHEPSFTDPDSYCRTAGAREPLDTRWSSPGSSPEPQS